MPAPIRLMVVDDHPLARQGLVAMLGAHEERFQVVAQAASLEEALVRAGNEPMDLVVTDLHLATDGSSNGIDLIRLLRAQQPGIKLVLITSELDEQFLLRAFDAGADAFLHKHAEASEIVRALEAVASGFTHFPAQLRAALDRRRKEPSLTPREGDILPYVARGMTAKQISRELTCIHPQKQKISDRTVEVHKGSIRQKFGLEEANALIPFAVEHCQRHRIDFKGMKIHSRRD